MSITTWAIRKDGNPEVGKTCYILISGIIGAGKSTFSGYVNEALTLMGYVSIQKSFADLLKEVALLYFGWDGIKDEKGRNLLQGLGNIGRSYNENLWVNSVVDLIDSLGVVEFVVIDDWRFPNEASVIRNKEHLDIVTARIHRDNIAINMDISEHSLSEKPEDYDYVVYNFGSLEDLEKSAKLLVEKILEVK